MIFSIKNFLVWNYISGKEHYVFALFTRVRRSSYFSDNGCGAGLTDNNGEHINRTRTVPFSDMFPFMTHKSTKKGVSMALTEQNCQLYLKVFVK